MCLGLSEVLARIYTRNQEGDSRGLEEKKSKTPPAEPNVSSFQLPKVVLFSIS